MKMVIKLMYDLYLEISCEVTKAEHPSLPMAEEEFYGIGFNIRKFGGQNGKEKN